MSEGRVAVQTQTQENFVVEEGGQGLVVEPRPLQQNARSLVFDLRDGRRCQLRRRARRPASERHVAVVVLAAEKDVVGLVGRIDDAVF